MYFSCIVHAFCGIFYVFFMYFHDVYTPSAVFFMYFHVFYFVAGCSRECVRAFAFAFAFVKFTQPQRGLAGNTQK